MELSNTDAGGRHAVTVPLGLAILGAFSILMLVSFGGQVIVAPGLLPAQWLVARATRGWISRTFAVLGGLLLIEVIPLGAVVLLGESNFSWVAGLLVALAGAVAFYRTTQEH